MSDQQESLILYKNHLSSHFQGVSSYLLAGPITTCAVGGHALSPTVNVDVRGCNTCVDFTTSRVAAPSPPPPPRCQRLLATSPSMSQWVRRRSGHVTAPQPHYLTFDTCHRLDNFLLRTIPKSFGDRFPPPIFSIFFVWSFLVQTIKLKIVLSNVTMEMSFKQRTIGLLKCPPWSVADQSIQHLTTIQSELVST